MTFFTTKPIFSAKTKDHSPLRPLSCLPAVKNPPDQLPADSDDLKDHKSNNDNNNWRGTQSLCWPALKTINRGQGTNQSG